MGFKLVNKWCLLALLPMVGCADKTQERISGSGKLTSEVRAVDTKVIQAIEINGTFSVSFSSNRKTPSILVTAEDNVIPYIETKQSNGLITISPLSGYNIQNTKSMCLDINATSLKDLVINGNGSFVVDTIQGLDPKITINGSGSLTVNNFKCAKSIALIAGNGVMELKGKLATLNTTINGSGQTYVYATTTKINGSITGSGVVRYKGTPAVSITVDGTGSATKF